MPPFALRASGGLVYFRIREYPGVSSSGMKRVRKRHPIFLTRETPPRSHVKEDIISNIIPLRPGVALCVVRVDFFPSTSLKLDLEYVPPTTKVTGGQPAQ